MTTSNRPFRTVVSERASVVAWCAWVAAAIAASIPAFRWHLDYARQGHPGLFWLFAAVVVGIPFVVAPIYQLLRRGGMWKREPLIVLLVVIAACCWYSAAGALYTLWLFLGAYCTGRFVLDRLRLHTESVTSELVFSFVTGFGVLVWPLVLLGHLGVYNRIALAALLFVAVAASFRSARRLVWSIRQLTDEWQASIEFSRPPVALAIVLLGVLVFAGLAVAVAPSIAFDPLRFHLPLARHYAETGSLAPLQADGYGYNPQNFEMLLTLGYTLSGQAAAQLVTPAFFVLFFLALYAVTRRLGFSQGTAVVAAVFAVALPYVHWTGVNVKHDVIVALFQLAALLAWFQWRRSRNFRWIYLGVFFCAMAFGFKHPAAFGILGLAPLYIWAAWKEPQRWRALIVCALGFVILGSFWQARSYALTGDPFHYYNFDQPLPGDHAEQVGSLANRLRTAVTWPYQIHFDSGLFFRSFTNNSAGFALLLFAPAWFLLRRRMGSEERAALLLAVVALVPWSLYVPLLRFVIAPVSILVLLTIARLCEWHSTDCTACRWPVRIAAGWAAAFSICVILILEVNAPQFRYLFSHRDREQYLQEALGTYPSLRLLGSMAAPGDRVLGINNCSMAYAPDPDIFYCRERDPNNPEDVVDLTGTLNDPRFRFVIIPSTPRWREVLQERAGQRPYRNLSTGDNFSIYELR
jgi:dolichyl-phosphate-mannose-protein mannosyltransferase